MIFFDNSLAESITIKVSKDLSTHNSNQIFANRTIFNVDRNLCVLQCEKLMGGNCNLRKFVAAQAKCECMHATHNFRDSRQVAPEMDGEVFYADR